MNLLKHASAIGRYFLLMMAIPAMAYATDQTKKSEPQSLICTPEEASVISYKDSKIEERKAYEAKGHRYLFTKLSNKWQIVFYPVYISMFSNCNIDDKQVFCYSDNRRLPSLGEFAFQKQSDSTIVFTSFTTFIDINHEDRESVMTMGYCRPFKG